MNIEELERRVIENTAALRARLAASHPNVIESVSGSEGRTGEFFVRELGAVVNLDHGRLEHVYDGQGAAMRERALSRQAAAREAYFARLFESFPAGVSVLNIGAGTDTALIRSVLSRTDQLLSTELDDAVVRLLQHEGFRAVAFDLSHLVEVLPEPVDFIVGNSVLGYADPTRIRAIVSQLAKSLRAGAIFTFDLAPHGKYFRIADGITQQTVANDSSLSPLVLLDFVRRLGARTGIDAWAHYSWARKRATDYAVVRALAGLFEEEGCHTRLFHALAPAGGLASSHVLRVAREPHAPVLKPSAEEVPMNDDEIVRTLAEPKVFEPLLFIDRDTGMKLAGALGLRVDWRASAWDVAGYVAKHQDCTRLSAAELHSNIEALAIGVRVSRIADAVRAGVLPPCRPIDKLLAVDQTSHKLVLANEMPISEEMADERLDELYARARAEERAQRAKDAKRDERRRKKDARKRDRR